MISWYEVESAEDLEMAELERLYREETEDKTWTCGYEDRFARWLELRPAYLKSQALRVSP